MSEETYVILGDVLADNGVNYAVFVKNVLMLSEQLKYLDPSYLVRDGEVTDMPDPEWLLAFRNYVERFMDSQSYDNRYYSNNDAISYNEPYQNAPKPSTVTSNTEDNIDNAHQYHDNNMMDQYEQSNNPTNYDYPEQPTNSLPDGISMYNPQAAYQPPFDNQLQQPIPSIENNNEQSSPFFINTALGNSNLQPSVSPDPSDHIGYPSVGGSAQESPIHYPTPNNDFKHDKALESSQASEITTNYFTKSNFQPDSSPSDKVSNSYSH